MLLLCAFSAAHAQQPQQELTVGGFKLSEFPAAGAPPIFRLVSAGAELRRELRYRLSAGATHQLAMIKAQSGIFGWVSDSSRFLQAIAQG